MFTYIGNVAKLTSAIIRDICEPGFKATGSRYQINIVSGGCGLYFKWCQGEAAGVGNQYNFVGVPTTFGRHCNFQTHCIGSRK